MMLPPAQRASLIFERFYAQNPHPDTELLYNSPFELLMAVMLSAQTTDKRVNQVTRLLFKRAHTPEAMLALGEETLQQAIHSVNYYVTKARHILQTCSQLLTLHHGQVPSDRAALEALPGVGRKTANVLLNTAFHQPTLGVDTHVFRVARRLELTNGRTPLAVEQDLLSLIEPKFLLHAHYWLVLHGRYTCLARKPRCSDCLIRDLCPFPKIFPILGPIYI